MEKCQDHLNKSCTKETQFYILVNRVPSITFFTFMITSLDLVGSLICHLTV